MKRERELESVIEEIVETGKAKNEKGEALYPVMQEPLVMALFGAPEALIEVLRERPGMVLNLTQTNKALAQFLDKFRNLWITLMDELVGREMGTYASEIYPFIVVSVRRLAKSKGGGVLSMFGRKATGITLRPFHHLTKFQVTEGPYYIVYHDPLTLLYFQLIERVVKLERLEKIDVSGMLNKYIGVEANRPSHIVKFVDLLLVDRTTRDNFKATYNLKEMRIDVAMIAHLIGAFVVGKVIEGEGVEITMVDRTTKKRLGLGIYHLDLVNELLQSQKLVAKLQLALADPNLVLEPHAWLELDKNLATPYRTLLYDTEQGLYPTQEAQKDFFMLMFNDLARIIGNTKVIEKYGQSLNCVLCHCETHSVDPFLMRAFCTENCRSGYLGHSLK